MILFLFLFLNTCILTTANTLHMPDTIYSPNTLHFRGIWAILCIEAARTNNLHKKLPMAYLTGMLHDDERYRTATSLEVGLLQLVLYVSWCDTLSRFWSFSPGLLSVLVAAIVSTEKMTNA